MTPEFENGNLLKKDAFPKKDGLDGLAYWTVIAGTYLGTSHPDSNGIQSFDANYVSTDGPPLNSLDAMRFGTLYGVQYQQLLQTL